MAHIELSREADIILIAPASADFLAKLAHGLADDLLSTAGARAQLPAARGPSHEPADVEHTRRRNAMSRTCAAMASRFSVRRSGEQACGEVGLGRMIEPEEIVEDVVAFFQPKHLASKRVLLTAGPTFEAIDPVRGITNLSSGKMGFALARAAREAGADVTLVCGPVSQATPRGITRIDVASALEMHAEVMQRIAGQDVFIGVAAVADYRPAAHVDAQDQEGRWRTHRASNWCRIRTSSPMLRRCPSRLSASASRRRARTSRPTRRRSGSRRVSR